MNRAISEAVYRLGEAGSAPEITGRATLQKIARIALEAVPLDVAGLLVFERGILKPATAAAVVGPWEQDLTDRFIEQARRDARDRVLSQQLAARPRDRMYMRDELMSDSDFQGSRVFTEFVRPMGLGDQAMGLFGIARGADVMVLYSSMHSRGPIERHVFESVAELAPYIVRCCESAWRPDAAWMTGLKPQSRQVLELVVRSYDDEQIAEATGLTYHSVRAHLKRLFRAAGVRSRLHLIQVLRGLDVAGGEAEVNGASMDRPDGDGAVERSEARRTPRVRSAELNACGA